MQESQEIRLFIVDDHELIRFAMQSWIQEESKHSEKPDLKAISVVGTAENGESALTIIRKKLQSSASQKSDTQSAERQSAERQSAEAPNFLLIDYQLPDMLGSEVIQTLRAEGIQTAQLRTLVMTGMENAPVKSILASGANGYLSKQESSKTFLAAIRSVFQKPDELWLNPDEAKRMLNAERSLKIAGITAAEKNIMSLLYLTNEEISESLAISKGTVKNHLNNIYAKLGINSRQEAEGFAVKVGLLPKSYS